MNTFLTKISCFEISLCKQSSFILTGLWKNLPSGIIGSIKTETLCLKRAALKCNRVLIVENIKKSWRLLMSHTVLRGESRDRCQKLSADNQIKNIFLLWFKLNKKIKQSVFHVREIWFMADQLHAFVWLTLIVGGNNSFFHGMKITVMEKKKRTLTPSMKMFWVLVFLQSEHKQICPHLHKMTPPCSALCFLLGHKGKSKSQNQRTQTFAGSITVT